MLGEDRFAFISDRDKAFIVAFNREMTRCGYSFGNHIGSGYCWGRYLLIYIRVGVKSKKVFAHIYIREESIVLCLFLNDIDRHRTYIENSPRTFERCLLGNTPAASTVITTKMGFAASARPTPSRTG